MVRENRMSQEGIMRTYETTILVKAAAARTDYDGTIAQVRQIYESEGAQFSEFDKWEERKLAYPIAGETTALYVIGYFSAEPKSLDAIERKATLSDVIVRQLV